MRGRNAHTRKTFVDDDGRVCTVCGEYKLRSEFSRSFQRNMKLSHTPNCKDCRNKMKREYRLRNNYSKDKEYKHRTRKLDIGQQVMIINNGVPTIYKVIQYKMKKGHCLQNIMTNKIRRIDTGDNQNKIKFHKI